MKPKFSGKRMSLNKQSIANLSMNEQSRIIAGNSQATRCGCPSYTVIICETVGCYTWDCIYTQWATCTIPAPSMCCDTDDLSCQSSPCPI